MSLYETLPDKSIVYKVNVIFYEKIYGHPWLSLFFKGVPEEHIRKQQTDFIVGAIGGPKLYAGRPARITHIHVFITDEVFDLRRSLLVEALDEARAPESLKEQWLRIDHGFRQGMVKRSLDQCTKRFHSDQILAFDEPRAPGRTG